MSLRQRPLSAHRMAPGTVSATPTAQPDAQHASSHAPSSIGSPRKGIRLNRVLGRIVPIILLIYLAYTYDLVVLRYVYRYLHIQRRRSLLALSWMVPTHALFLYSLRTYLRVFFAHSADRRGCLRSLLGATFPDPDSAQQLEQRSLTTAASRLIKNDRGVEIKVELCQADGLPIRCFRDSCAGHIKVFRMRHCGDCGTCRVGFDHHCAWFDNDVASPATLPSFIRFLLSVPPLILLAVGPIVPSAWSTIRRISSFSSSGAQIRTQWYSKWYSWTGGPAFRWMVDFGLGASKWAKTAKGRAAHESPRAPVIVAFGAMLVFVATALAASSLTQLRTGLLTVDLERSKAWARLERQKMKMDPSDERVKELEAKMDALAPVQHFKVCLNDRKSGETTEKIVALSIEEGLLSHGSTSDNYKRFLGLSSGSSDANPAWSLPDSALRKVLIKASVPLHD